MHVVGPANWVMPHSLDRILPNLSIEAGDEPSGAPERDDPGAVPATGDEPAHAAISAARFRSAPSSCARRGSTNRV